MRPVPLLLDGFRERQPLPEGHMAFSNGRAALAWLIEQKKPKTALVCAYTCPLIPPFLRNKGIDVSFFDVTEDISEAIADLVLIPSQFGDLPIQHCNSGTVVIDAALSAFGHQYLFAPKGGAVLSCPRKATSMPEGAILVLGEGLKAQSLSHLRYRSTEEGWPSVPCRMNEESKGLFERLDPDYHNTARWRNFDILEAALGKTLHWKFKGGTPFFLPVLADGLSKENLYLRFWASTEHDPEKHPEAAYLATYLVQIPIDQRFPLDLLLPVVEAVLSQAKPPPSPPAGLSRHLVL